MEVRYSIESVFSSIIFCLPFNIICNQSLKLYALDFVLQTCCCFTHVEDWWAWVRYKILSHEFCVFMFYSCFQLDYIFLSELLVYWISCCGSQGFVKTGICKYGAKCKFDHPKDKRIFKNIISQRVWGCCCNCQNIGTMGLWSCKWENKGHTYKYFYHA